MTSKHPKILLAGFIVMLGFAAPGNVYSQEDDFQSFIDWFGNHELPLVDGLTFVSIDNGPFSIDSQKGLHRLEPYGFLVRSDKDKGSFEVISTLRTPRKFEPSHTFIDYQPSYKTKNFVEWVNESIPRWSQGISAKQNSSFIHGYFGHHLAVIHASLMCHQLGHSELALQLYQMFPSNLMMESKPTPGGRLKSIQIFLAHHTVWDIYLDFGTPHINRRELLKKIERWQRDYPANLHSERADRLKKTLSQMIDEDTESLKDPILISRGFAPYYTV